MTLSSFIITLVIGAIAGWLAGQIVKGHGQGLLTNIIVGILGAVIASFLFPALGLGMFAASPVLGSIIYSTIGAVILLFVLRLVQRA
ncbi:GlsB/YeaQ/YmgE family stress response membrane protein [Paracoccus aestuariivivens]|uniref:GlsB/YeaQ/YmgE family stress response membrane protein n=1 Tax=Paracoccus aestuariivivens TaxID=1820333 RepID=A0A6L6J6P8_9RHOB|nr:GlsB/YeaQ/YmgE family stress response membrane protein [Paracoccus aestuariivivens]MTH77793.1 GlsB/YeaQ/YmgE family stress response membrane protein [Paracoccus aestuariivivens]